jgi:nitrogen-specific signal transduction histidine kinase
MSEEVKDCIFDHLFTTKDVGQGTGLGLAIARQIVEEKHGGKLSCISALGVRSNCICLKNNNIYQRLVDTVLTCQGVAIA